MKYKVFNKAPSKQAVARMLRRRGVVTDDKFSGFDFHKIESAEAIEGIAGYLSKKAPSYYSIVIGLISDNSNLSRAVADHLHAKHYFVSQSDLVRETLQRFNGSKKVNVLIVKALVDDADINEWHDLPSANENIQRIAIAAVVDGRFIPCQINMEIFSLTDYDYIHL